MWSVIRLFAAAASLVTIMMWSVLLAATDDIEAKVAIAASFPVHP